IMNSSTDSRTRPSNVRTCSLETLIAPEVQDPPPATVGSRPPAGLPGGCPAADRWGSGFGKEATNRGREEGRRNTQEIALRHPFAALSARHAVCCGVGA